METLYPQRRGDTEATLSGRVNPQNLETTYHFEFGPDTNYGQGLPVPEATIPADSGDRPIDVAVDVQGLSPNTTYHYRLVASNGAEVAPGDTTVEGADVAFTTPGALPDTSPQRPFEMVTPPFKVVRAAVKWGAVLHLNPNPGLPSLDGDTVLWGSPFFPLTEDVGMPASDDDRILRRTPAGWVNETLNTLKLPGDSNPKFLNLSAFASSGDLETQPLELLAGLTNPVVGNLLPSEGTTPNRHYTRRPGTGIKGYSNWLTNPDAQYPGLPADDVDYSFADDAAVLNDDGSAMARWGRYFGLGEDHGSAADEDPSDDLDAGSRIYTGKNLYLQRAEGPDLMPSAPKEIASQCTGTAGVDATQVPARLGSGAPTDTIGAQDCAGGALTSKLGAVAGGGGPANSPPAGPVATSLSDDGRRLFFTSPDPGPLAGPVAPACRAATGPDTSCPPQLYVRQYDSSGDPTVRWISRSRSAPAARQRLCRRADRRARGRRDRSGARLPGRLAHRRGRLLQHQRPARPHRPQRRRLDHDRRRLRRILGPLPLRIAGESRRRSRRRHPDPGLRRAERRRRPRHQQSGSSAGRGGVLRFLSDDGERAYFLTTSPIAGADTTPPADGDTAPAGAPGNIAVRNLYLFDEGESGAARYRFIARIPFFGGGSSTGESPNELNGCASHGEVISYHLSGGGDGIAARDGNCFRGTPSGNHIAFFTQGQLTPEDNDQAGDLYLYEPSPTS